MSNSAFAYLVFGINFDEENPMDTIKEKMGFDSEDYFYDLKSLFNANREEGQEPITSFPLDIITHCRTSYPCYILAASAPKWNPWRGEADVIDPAKLVVPQETIDFMKDFCEKYGLEWSEPAWLLCPYTED